MKTLLALAVLLAFEAFAGNLEDYEPTTIHKIYLRYESVSKEERTDSIPDSQYIPMNPSGTPFSSETTFWGKIRILSEFNIANLELFGKVRKLNVLDLFKNEILIKDIDGRQYWIPIQETHLDSFKVECKDECKVILYLLWILNFEQKPFVLINEFQVQQSAP